MGFPCCAALAWKGFGAAATAPKKTFHNLFI